MTTRSTLVGLVALCAGCLGPTEEREPTPPSASGLETAAVPGPRVEPAPAAATSCPAAKFSFTQFDGCRNDGWVEFCARKTGAAVVSQLRAIAPGLSLLEGRLGNAGCDEALDYLARYPLDTAAECAAASGALTNATWDRLCQLAAVPETRHFVGGWGE